MRTTIILEDKLFKKVRGLVAPRGLSDFVNACVRERFEREERAKRHRELEDCYRRAAKDSVGKEFDGVDSEGWPEW